MSIRIRNIIRIENERLAKEAQKAWGNWQNPNKRKIPKVHLKSVNYDSNLKKKKFSFNRYLNYINSKAWKRKRGWIIKIQEKCFICGHRKKLQVHHLSYKNLGEETEKDLLVLCWKCHQEATFEENGERRKLEDQNKWIEEKQSMVYFERNHPDLRNERSI